MYSLAAPFMLIVFLYNRDIKRFSKQSTKIITALYLLQSISTL